MINDSSKKDSPPIFFFVNRAVASIIFFHFLLSFLHFYGFLFLVSSTRSLSLALCMLIHGTKVVKVFSGAHAFCSPSLFISLSLFSSYKQTDPKTIEHSAFNVSALLRKPNWEQDNLLKSVVSHMTPHVASNVISLHNINPQLGVRFFKWVCKQSTYCYDIEHRIHLVNLIVSSNLYGVAHGAIFSLIKDSAKSEIEILKLMDAIDCLSESGFRLNYPCYSTLLMSLAKLNMGFLAYSVYERMVAKGFVIGNIDYKTIINALCKNGLVEAAEMFLCRVLKLGFRLDTHIFTSLVLGYCRVCDLKRAFLVFEKMSKEDGCLPNSVTWTILIHGLCEMGRLDEAFDLKEKMSERGCQQSTRTYTVLIKALCDNGWIDKALCLLDEMVAGECKPNIHTYTVLIDKLCRGGKVAEANGMVRRIVKDGLFPSLVTYNALINGYCKQGQIISAFELLSVMEKRNCKPDIRTYNELMDGLCRVNKPYKAVFLLQRVIDSGLLPTTVTYNILIDGFCREGKLDMAYKVFNLMNTFCLDPDCYSFTTIIDGLCRQKKLELASAFLGLMVKRGISHDEITFTALINGYCKAGKTRDALAIFAVLVTTIHMKTSHALNIFLDVLSKLCKLKEEYALIGKILKYGLVPSVVTYTILIDGLIRTGDVTRSFNLIEMMKRNNCPPNVYTYTVVINGLCQLGRVEEAEALLFRMSGLGVSPNQVTYTVLVNAHVNAGRINRALEITSSMVRNGCQPNNRTYSALLAGFVLSEKTAEAETYSITTASDSSEEDLDECANNLFREMNVEHALSLQNKIEKFGGSTVDLYNFLVVGLCREGRFSEAHYLTQHIVRCGVFPDKAIYSLIEWYCTERKYDECIKFIASLVSSGFLPSFESYCLVIQGLYNDGKSEEVQRVVSDLLRSSGIEEEAATLPYIEFLLKGDELSSKYFELQNLVERGHHGGRPVI
ncbi:pentatricopeptide repeat-containing protein At3g07290, mitochondrial [Carica papaya]|uniref:pentatricopeptide repeat-containing protein At3g07290, mitochondrial n=1 Tax=Carica papaya TaxID=3649 RepID=UPI000B8C6E76|nr:pentatricopeptide repeat-containing protein At3g07290, mitochondrial [Carica papaya]XP_021907172.1 pentatricopeptide repeat-containing protein At3g07290, mitochondrial [Carica papaya]XP_021907173.1 pentatricopeptide repeat-containing protein At3g07290, mitochondrial [Carica papaya]XP_021907174.1 pentatricopeptide repeat-containing protein At3g07290, mitochondrial [Carica papaya]